MRIDVRASCEEYLYDINKKNATHGVSDVKRRRGERNRNRFDQNGVISGIAHIGFEVYYHFCSGDIAKLMSCDSLEN